MSEAATTFRGAVWNHAGKLLEYLLMYITSVVIARSLGVEENGVYASLVSLSQLLLVLSSFGLETSLNKHIPQLDASEALERTRYILRRALLLRVLIFCAIAACVAIACQLRPALLPYSLSMYLYLLIAYAATRSVVPLFAVVLTAQLRTALLARISLTVRGIELLLVVAVSQRGLLLDRLLATLVFTGVLHVAAYVFFSRTNWMGKVRSVSTARIVAFGGLFWINVVIDYFLGRQGDVLFLSSLLPDASQASIYDVAYSLMQVAALGMTIGLSGVALATFAKLAVSSASTLRRFYGFLVRATSLLTIPLYAFLLFNAQSIVMSIYSPPYIDAAGLLEWMVVFRIVGRLFAGGENADFLLSIGRVGTVVGLSAAAAAVNIGLNLLLIPGMHAMGSVLASGTANLLVNCFGAILVFRVTGDRLQTRFWLVLTLICLSASWVCSVIMSSQGLLMLIPRAALYVAVLMIAMRMVRPLSGIDLEWLSKAVPGLAGWFAYFSRAGSAGTLKTGSL